MSLENELVRQINSLQKQVDALVKPEVSRWMDWTPTITQGVAVTKTITYARYVAIGNTIVLQTRLAVTSAGTAGQAIIIGGIPINIANSGDLTYVVGIGTILDVSVAYYGGLSVAAESATTLSFTGYTVANRMGISPNFGLANGDVISFQATYERA